MTAASDLLAVVHDKERRALEALIGVYGDDTSAVLNGLHSMAARIAIATGVSPEDFAAGMKHHWDFLATAFNDQATTHTT
jgi:hypothetical protein